MENGRLVSALLVVCLSLSGLPASAQEATPSGGIKALAVMYFENRSAGGEWQWLSTGIADMLISDLGRSERLLVVERERLAAMLQELRLVEGGLIDPANAAKVGQVTKVDWVLFGSFAKKGESLSMEGHILEVKSGQLLRVEQVEGKAKDVLALEKRLADQLLTRLDVPLTEGERQGLLARKPTDSLDALTHYYQGIEAYESGDYHRALAEFRLAGRQDPGYLEARVQAAEMYFRIEEPKHALVEYHRLTDPDRDKALPDFVYYSLGRLLESGLKDYRAAIDAYHVITDRRPDFRFTAEEVRQAVQELRRLRDTVRPGSQDDPFEKAKRTWPDVKTPCSALERIAICHERLGETAAAAQQYLVRNAFLAMRGMSVWDLGVTSGTKVHEVHGKAVRENVDRDLLLVEGVVHVPESGWLFEPLPPPVPRAAAVGGRAYRYMTGRPAVFIAPPDQEIESLVITTWSLEARPAEGYVQDPEGPRPPFRIGFSVHEYGKEGTLCSLRFPPYEGMKWLPSYGWDAKFEFEEARSLAGGLTLSEVEPRQDGRRTYKVELPPALRGVDVAPMRADWKCVVATRPWSGAQQPTKMWVRDWVRLTITIDPEPAAEVYYDGKLSPWPPGRPITSHGQNIQEAGKHHLRVVWPDGRSADADFEVALGGDVDLLMTADKRIVEKRTIAQTGSHPYLFRDRRGCNWLLWDEAVTQHGGTFLVQRAPESDLYFATSPDGSSWSAPRRLPVSSPDLDMQPILQQDSRGTYWLAWLSDRDPEHPKSLWLSSSADGAKWSYPRRMRLGWANDRAKDAWFRRPVPQFGFLVDSNNTFWVVWQGQISRSLDGSKWSAPEVVTTRGEPGSENYIDYNYLSFQLSQAADGDLLLLAPKSGQSRENVALFSSRDGTEWVEKEVMGAADSGSLARGPNGRLVAVSGGGSRIFIRISEDGRSWTGPLLVETYHTYPWHPTIALLSHDQCLVAFSSDEGLTVLRCRLPGAAAEEKLPTTSVSAVAGPLEAGPTKRSAQPTILVLPFRGEQTGEQAALGEALAEVLTIDLARQEGVSVVDRSHLASVLQEQKLSLSGLVDQAAQLQVGKLLGAKLLLAGSFVLTQGKLTVTAHLFDVSTTQLVKSEEVSGEVGDWLGVEKQLALALAKDLNLKLDEVQVRAIDEKPEVNLHFIRGLGYYYANRHDEAIMEFLNTLFGDEKYVDARYWMARSYLATAEPEHARLEFERIVREYPEHQLARSAKELLSQPISLGGQGSPGP